MFYFDKKPLLEFLLNQNTAFYVNIILAIIMCYLACNRLNRLFLRCANRSRKLKDNLIIYYQGKKKAVYYDGDIMTAQGCIDTLYATIIISEPQVIIFNMITRKAKSYGSKEALPEKYQKKIEWNKKHIY